MLAFKINLTNFFIFRFARIHKEFILHKNVIADYTKCTLSDHDDKHKDTVNVQIQINV